MNYTVVFEGDSSPTADRVSDILAELGYYPFEDSSASRRLMDSVNLFRRAEGLSEADYIDPATLRAMGIEADGDEIIVMARAAASGETELAAYDICREIVGESRKLGITLSAAAERRIYGNGPANPPTYCVTAAILALLNQ